MTLEQSKEHQEFWAKKPNDLNEELKNTSSNVEVYWELDTFKAFLIRYGDPICAGYGPTINDAVENLREKYKTCNF